MSGKQTKYTEFFSFLSFSLQSGEPDCPTHPLVCKPTGIVVHRNLSRAHVHYFGYLTTYFSIPKDMLVKPLGDRLCRNFTGNMPFLTVFLHWC